MNARFGYRMNNGKLVDTMVNDALWDAFNQYHMMITAENVAEQYGITREELDEFSANSQQKCEAAIAAGKFKDEIVPVEIKSKRKQSYLIPMRDHVLVQQLRALVVLDVAPVKKAAW